MGDRIARRRGEVPRLIVGSVLGVVGVAVVLLVDWRDISRWWLAAWAGLVCATAVLLLWDDWRRP